MLLIHFTCAPAASKRATARLTSVRSLATSGCVWQYMMSGSSHLLVGHLVSR